MIKWHSRNLLWRCAFIMGLIGAVMAGLVLWFAFAFSQGHVTEPIGWLFVLFPLCSVAIALKWPVAGGVLLVLEGLAAIGQLGLALIMITNFHTDSISWWLLLIPLFAGVLLLTSGILFFVLWSRRQPSETLLKKGENHNRLEVNKVRKLLAALAAVLVPLITVFVIISLNVRDAGTPKWVGQVWRGGIAYWAASIIILIIFTVMHKGAIAKGIGIGVGVGFFILILATGLQL